MKESDAQIEYDKHQLLLYVEKNDGEYGPLQTGSFLTKNYVDDFWAKQKRFQGESLNDLVQGKISPVGYYMTMINISAGDLAARVGISRSKVQKHTRPQHFQNIGIPLLRKYAEVFGVPLANMFQIVIQKETFPICQRQTTNPMIVITEIAEEKK